MRWVSLGCIVGSAGLFSTSLADEIATSSRTQDLQEIESLSEEQAPEPQDTPKGLGKPYSQEALESQIDSLQIQLSRVQDKIDVLRDTVLGGAIARCRALISYHSSLGEGYVVEQLIYTLDGATILSRENKTGVLEPNSSFHVYDGPMEPGYHQLEVEVVLRAESMGLFTYLEGYRFRVGSKYRFKVVDGKFNQLQVSLEEHPDVTRDVADRLRVRYELTRKEGS